MKVAGLIVLIVGLTVVGGLIVYGWWLHPGYERQSFTVESWADADPETRGHMVKSLLADHPLRGRSQNDIIALLGEPDGKATVDAMYERDRASGLDDTRLREIYGTRADERLHHAAYQVGHMGWREGAPFVFSYTLHVLFRDGVATRAYVDD